MGLVGNQGEGLLWQHLLLQSDEGHVRSSWSPGGKEIFPQKFDTFGLIVFKKFSSSEKLSMGYFDMICNVYCIGFHPAENMIQTAS